MPARNQTETGPFDFNSRARACAPAKLCSGFARVPALVSFPPGLTNNSTEAAEYAAPAAKTCSACRLVSGFMTIGHTLSGVRPPNRQPKLAEVLSAVLRFAYN